MLPTIPLERWVPNVAEAASSGASESRALEPGPAGIDIELTRRRRGLSFVGGDVVLRDAGRWLGRLLGGGGTEGARPKRPPWFLPAVALFGLAVGVAVTGWLTRRDGPRVSASSPAAPVLAPSSASAPAAESSPEQAGASTPLPCTPRGAPQTLAPKALVSVGLEVETFGASALGLGLASSEHDAIALRVDPSTLSATSAQARVRGSIRHVFAAASEGAQLEPRVDADRKSDPVRARRTISSAPPLQIGASDDGIVWSRPNAPAQGTLWRMEGGADVEALRAAVGAGLEPTTAIAFRRGNAIYIGVASGRDALTPASGLLHFEGLGAAVGAPAIALGDSVVMATWADRPSADEPWRLRWVHFGVHDPAPVAQTFPTPEGGRGDQAMSPSVTAIPGKRFLLVWTEGATAEHDVRAVTLNEAGERLGDPLMLSAPGANAGQGQAAVTDGGDGLVAFLESNGTGFEVVATPIACPLRSAQR